MINTLINLNQFKHIWDIPLEVGAWEGELYSDITSSLLPDVGNFLRVLEDGEDYKSS